MDTSNNLYVADQGNSRVLFFATGQSSGSAVASRVYGQNSGYGTGTSNLGGTTSANTLSAPYAIALDSSNNLYVADGSMYNRRRPSRHDTSVSAALLRRSHLTAARVLCVTLLRVGNNRILFFTSGSNTATAVYGQSSWSGSGSAVGATGLSTPTGITLDAAGNLYVADFYNYRVLVFPTGGVSSNVAQAAGTTASNVYGQADFNSNAPNRGGSTPSAIGMVQPEGVAVDASGNVYVADVYNNRVPFFPAGQALGAQAATRVYGQF